mmetsp:Transcript_36726/g.88264  ORF Transcript_36726/g.88264 Transcript_36726/m.88264 type:complete len:200 (+) Transcript_36726:235-834(+)
MVAASLYRSPPIRLAKRRAEDPALAVVPAESTPDLRSAAAGHSLRGSSYLPLGPNFDAEHRPSPPVDRGARHPAARPKPRWSPDRCLRTGPRTVHRTGHWTGPQTGFRTDPLVARPAGSTGVREAALRKLGRPAAALGPPPAPLLRPPHPVHSRASSCHPGQCGVPTDLGTESSRPASFWARSHHATFLRPPAALQSQE